MTLLQALVSRSLRLYGKLPYHPGKWRVVDGICTTFGLHDSVPGTQLVTRDRLRYEVDPKFYIDRTILYLGCYELFDTRMIERIVQPGWTVMDVGANIGWHTVHLAARVGPGGRVFAFEPAGVDRGRLEANVRANGFAHVEVVPVAVGRRVGQAAFSDATDAGTGHLLVDASAGNTVPITTLDTFMEERKLDRLDFVKVDVEGAEGRFLDGGMETLRRLRPSLMIELHEENLRRFGTSRVELMDRLADLGYAIHRNNRGRLTPLDSLPSHHVNAFCLPRDGSAGRA